MRRIVAGAAFLGSLLSAVQGLCAQVQDKPFLEEERRRELEERRKSEEERRQPFLWDAGGWIHSEFIKLDDAPNRTDRTLRYYDVRLWGEATFEKHYTAYVRLQSQYTDFNQGDQFSGDDDNRFRTPHLDQAYLEAEFESEAGDSTFTARAGKEFFTLGRGLLLNGVNFGGNASWTSGRVSLRGLTAHSVVTDDDIDKSRPNSRESRRLFMGGEAGYILGGDHRAYVMTLFTRDLSREEPEKSATQDWEYNANYVGVGERGSIVGGLGYSVEADHEFGTSTAAGSNEQEAIHAWAFLGSLDYRFELPTSPYVVLEYMYGSGDNDRASVTDMTSGNTEGTRDEGFLAFGYVQTGFALFPRLSNIHIYRAGATFRPLESVEGFRFLEMGVFGYLYRKAQEDAPTSDPRSTNSDSDIGKEVDVMIRWRLLSDVGFSLNYGRFLPGKAVDEDQKRDFISVGMTFSF